jgi:D-glycero-D-manno-heptose 1,7-bisphosphate phosphatase
VTAAVFVDRDGVINELVLDPVSGRPESPLDPGDVRLIDGAAAALRALAAGGWRLVGVTNQPAAAKGTAAVDELESVQRRIVDLLAGEGVRFDRFEMCLHHPDGAVGGGLTGRCDCRKPAPGLLLTAGAAIGAEMRRSWMVGDTDADIEAGIRAGTRTILVEHPGSAHKRIGRPAATWAVPDLTSAAAHILLAEE